MNANQPEKLVPPADRNRVPSAGDTANPDELKDDLEKYEHLQEVGGAILPGETAPPSGTTAPAALNSHNTFSAPAFIRYRDMFLTNRQRDRNARTSGRARTDFFQRGCLTTTFQEFSRRPERLQSRSFGGCLQKKWPKQRNLLAMTIDSDMDEHGASRGTISRNCENIRNPSVYADFERLFRGARSGHKFLR